MMRLSNYVTGMRRTTWLMIGCKRLMLAFPWVTTLLCYPAISDELQEGRWGGFYKVHGIDPLEAQYQVRHSSTERTRVWQITMSLDLEPRAAFTYDLEDIVVGGGRLSFIIRKPHELKHCELIQQHEDGDYVGSCRADTDPDGKRLAGIVMMPPSQFDQ